MRSHYLFRLPRNARSSCRLLALIFSHGGDDVPDEYYVGHDCGSDAGPDGVALFSFFALELCLHQCRKNCRIRSQEGSRDNCTFKNGMHCEEVR